jgi:hypothetical protein
MEPTASRRTIVVCLLQNSGLSEGADYRYLTYPRKFALLSLLGFLGRYGGGYRVGDDVIGFLQFHAFGLP